MLPRFNCKRCNHTWIPRTDVKPVVCPSCKSPYWDKEKNGGEGKDERKNNKG